ncbi:spore coat U domain-containing protein [Paraburkholderia acidicola]|uniref:Spore coat U domain-containing protein n=1 Tax=Paraburkholderia acidicola TaxID=1912599 RepID=A0ABV1LU26_9BURK
MTTSIRRLKCCVIAGTAGLFFGFGSFDARAQCSVVAATDASFGAPTSFTVRTAQQSGSTINSGLTCDGTGAGGTLLSTDEINMTLSSQNGERVRGSTGDVIPYRIFADADARIPVNSGRAVNWAANPLRSTLSLFGGTSLSPPLYFRTTPGANVAAGTYTDTIIINWNWNYCTRRALFGAVCGSVDRGSGQFSTIELTLIVTNDCTIAAPDISFGAAPDPASFSPVTGGIGVTCTKGLTYTVGVSGGSFPAANGRRQMASSGGGRLQYDIFNGRGATVWGQDTNRVSSVSAADGLSAQQFPFRAAIYADQETPPVGIYTDSVVVDVRY